MLQAPKIKNTGLLGKDFAEVTKEIKEKSTYKDVDNYGLISIIVKSGDDLRQEQFASQLISKFKNIFENHKLKLWLKPFNILATCPNGGLIQTITDAVSIDSIKKKNRFLSDLKDYFTFTYGGYQNTAQTKKAL